MKPAIFAHCFRKKKVLMFGEVTTNGIRDCIKYHPQPYIISMLINLNIFSMVIKTSFFILLYIHVFKKQLELLSLS